jgi:hypothetical protein
MNINRATRFFRSHHTYAQIADQLNPESGINYLAFKWSHYERIILSDFKHRYKIDLSIEQRWHIFLTLMEELPFPLDNSLGDFLMNGVIKTGDWALLQKSESYSMNREDPIDVISALNGFPKDSLFMYSLENADIVYEGDVYAQRFKEHFLAHEFISTVGELRDWYQGFFEMRESVIKDEAYPSH